MRCWCECTRFRSWWSCLQWEWCEFYSQWERLLFYSKEKNNYDLSGSELLHIGLKQKFTSLTIFVRRGWWTIYFTLRSRRSLPYLMDVRNGGNDEVYEVEWCLNRGCLLKGCWAIKSKWVLSIKLNVDGIIEWGLYAKKRLDYE